MDDVPRAWMIGIADALPVGGRDMENGADVSNDRDPPWGERVGRGLCVSGTIDPDDPDRVGLPQPIHSTLLDLRIFPSRVSRTAGANQPRHRLTSQPHAAADACG